MIRNKYFKMCFSFFGLALLVVGLGYLITIYEKSYAFGLLYHNWDIYDSLGYNRFNFIYNFYMILAYSFMLLIVMKDFVLITDIHYILRHHSYKNFLNALLKHFFIKILLFNIILMLISSVAFCYFDYQIIIFIIKNTLAFVVMIYIYMFILYLVGDNQSLFLFLIILTTLIDIWTRSCFLAYGDHMMIIYMCVYIFLIIILKKILEVLYKKGCMEND